MEKYTQAPMKSYVTESAADVCSTLEPLLKPLDLSGKPEPALDQCFSDFKSAFTKEVQRSVQALQETGSTNLFKQSLFGTALVRVAQQHLQCPVSKATDMTLYGTNMLDEFSSKRDTLESDDNLFTASVDLAKAHIVSALTIAADSAMTMAANPMLHLADSFAATGGSVFRG